MGGTAGIGALLTKTFTIDDFIHIANAGTVDVVAWTEDAGTWFSPYEAVMPGDTYTATLTVENAGTSDAYIALIGRDIVNPELLEFGTLTIKENERPLEPAAEAPLWDGRAYKVGQYTGGQRRTYTVTVTFDESPDADAWAAAAQQGASMDLDAVATQVKGNPDDEAALIGYGS
ncbi:hypothetical protein [Cellulomonas uda]|uniref:Uncharacterized protein n=1 Tax=Cellulomonas uda TaxID=1714 RepID=A0A4Y3KCW9_CELUD|nr:hypothetical protein [Cellulomonas uda]NII68001.1 hypothetical protein [Cellulomonas uda]GEA81234.1 hypothetical protein CUD01_16780 [Cellulomonas uda]